MTPEETQTFNQAVRLAQAGDNLKAYSELKQLSRATGARDPNLLLWLAFTSPDIDEAETAITMAESYAPFDPSVTQARAWIVQEKSKKQQHSPIPPIIEEVQTKPALNAFIPTPPTAPARPSSTTVSSPALVTSPQVVDNSYPSGATFMQPQQVYQQVQYGTFYQQQSQPPAAAAVAANVPPKNNRPLITKGIYGVAGLGLVGTAIGTLLPWLQYGYYSLEISVNGINGLSGPTAIVGQVAKSGDKIDIAHGLILFLIVALAVFAVLLGFAHHSKAYGILTGLLGVGLMGVLINDFVNISRRVSDYNHDALRSEGAQIGIGLYVTALAIALVLACGLILSTRDP